MQAYMCSSVISFVLYVDLYMQSCKQFCCCLYRPTCTVLSKLCCYMQAYIYSLEAILLQHVGLHTQSRQQFCCCNMSFCAIYHSIYHSIYAASSIFLPFTSEYSCFLSNYNFSQKTENDSVVCLLLKNEIEFGGMQHFST